ncbi:NAD(P)/FAD-dependent oxidoreductase [Methylobacter sp. YRD-M1]|uniref:NAD(P)/FAD-dependent oxidoreductase n=1 Tax=Methylobacter sp. YRD-M1 TaxID=2911520 RepID=UPI00227C5DBE|nr:NAD(P)/FAD-dependent oxidoreductase [Methylobacter sp. YRD-M1]WAK02123.1 tryptophan 7-halogenase [Methylobacter sp. YRD-M1]
MSSAAGQQQGANIQNSSPYHIIIIGAGPSGSIAGALLTNKGYRVTILERNLFPRFSIGESLLPQCMEFIKEAGMLEAVVNAGFQYKDGASFVRGCKYTDFSFEDKFTDGIGTTFQVQRGTFDMLLAQEAERMGVEIRWQQEVLEADFSAAKPKLTVRDASGELSTCEADFVLDASGFGRILPRLLDLESPSGFPVRQALFTHIEDRIDADARFDRNKIRITVHPDHEDVWFWLIPFSNGRSSLGVVARQEFFHALTADNKAALQQVVGQDPSLTELLGKADFDSPVNTITGYSANVKSLYGKGYALLGNAGEFLDPVFSSGVTIAMKSASLAAAALDRQFNGEAVDWQTGYASPLQRGVDTFRVFVDAWYDGRFQDVIFHDKQQPEVKAMISSILAGYAWDENNPYVKNARSRLDTLAAFCRSDKE